MHLGFADLFRAAIFAAAHVFAGSLGAGIVAVSLGVRLALLPLTIRLARRALAQQAILARLQPELQRLQARYGNDPAARWRRTQALYRRGRSEEHTPELPSQSNIACRLLLLKKKKKTRKRTPRRRT